MSSVLLDENGSPSRNVAVLIAEGALAANRSAYACEADVGSAPVC
jgi:hypothetical protein